MTRFAPTRSIPSWIGSSPWPSRSREAVSSPSTLSSQPCLWRGHSFWIRTWLYAASQPYPWRFSNSSSSSRATCLVYQPSLQPPSPALPLSSSPRWARKNQKRRCVCSVPGAPDRKCTVGKYPWHARASGWTHCWRATKPPTSRSDDESEYMSFSASTSLSWGRWIGFRLNAAHSVARGSWGSAYAQESNLSDSLVRRNGSLTCFVNQNIQSLAWVASDVASQERHVWIWESVYQFLG